MSNAVIKNNIIWARQVTEYFFRPELEKLSASSFLVFVCLWMRSVPLTGLVSASYRELMAWTRIGGKDTVARAIKELLDKGYLRLVRVGGKPSHKRLYRLETLTRTPHEFGDGSQSRALGLELIKVVDEMMEVIESDGEPRPDKG